MEFGDSSLLADVLWGVAKIVEGFQSADATAGAVPVRTVMKEIAGAATTVTTDKSTRELVSLVALFVCLARLELGPDVAAELPSNLIVLLAPHNKPNQIAPQGLFGVAVEEVDQVSLPLLDELLKTVGRRADDGSEAERIPDAVRDLPPNTMGPLSLRQAVFARQYRSLVLRHGTG